MAETKMTFAQPPGLANAELALVQGDLSRLNEEQRLAHYINTCNSLGLNYHTQPFEYIAFQGKLKLYARKECADQLRAVRGISVVGDPITNIVGDVLTVTVRMRDKDGREDADMGALSLKGMNDSDKAIAFMKCLTKAKRRTTFSLVGLGWLDNDDGDRPTLDITQSSQPQLPAPPLFDKIKEALESCQSRDDLIAFKLEYDKVKGRLSGPEQATIGQLAKDRKAAIEGAGVAQIEAPKEVVVSDVKPDSVVGNPISVKELGEIVTRVQSGESTPAEEMAKNLTPAEDPAIREFHLNQAIVLTETLDAYSLVRDRLVNELATFPHDAQQRLKATAKNHKEKLEKKLAS